MMPVPEFDRVMDIFVSNRGRTTVQAPHDVVALPENVREAIALLDSRRWDEMEWTNGFTLLHFAAMVGRTDLCASFLQRRADPNAIDADGKTPLQYAQESKREGAEQLLIATLAAWGTAVQEPPPPPPQGWAQTVVFEAVLGNIDPKRLAARPAMRANVASTTSSAR